jgi:hypothetical protein
MHVRAGAVFYQCIGDNDVDIGVRGIAINFDPGADTGEAGVFGRAGFNITLASGFGAFGQIEALHTDGIEAVSGSAGVRVKF